MAKVVKQNKLVYYIRGFTAPFFRSGYAKQISRLEKRMTENDRKEIAIRLHYYNKLSGNEAFDFSGMRTRNLIFPATMRSFFYGYS